MRTNKVVVVVDKNERDMPSVTSCLQMDIDEISESETFQLSRLSSKKVENKSI